MKIFAFTHDLYIRLTRSGRLLSVLIVAMFLGSLLYGFDAAAQVSNGVYFSINKGYTDGIPRQVVRTNSDRLYIFTPNAQSTNLINVYWTNGTGLPSNATAFNGSTSLTETDNPLSVDAVYDGGSIIHVLVNTNPASANQGVVKDHPFDLSNNTFRSPITLATNTPTVVGDYIGSSGVSGMIAGNGLLHVAYWSSGNHITYQAYTYNSGNNTLTPSGGSTQVDTSGSANHPIVAISPLDDSVTISWISETNPVQILARTRSSGGTWGNVEVVNTSGKPPWTSTSAGINIDQGPSLIITPNGTRHLLFIENWDNTNFYGHVHYVTKSGSGAWNDTTLNFYSHNPGLATNALGDIYLVGHGSPAANQNTNLYVLKKNSDGTWGTQQIFATPGTGENFDASPSIKWSRVGFNRPDIVEFAFFSPILGNYNHTNIYYGRFSIGGGTNPVNTPTYTPSNTPSKTPTPTNTPTSTPATPDSPSNATPGPHFFAVRHPTLTWNVISWALAYQIQIDDDPNFGSPITVPDEFSATTLRYTVTANLGDGIYYWHVRARKSANVNDWSKWSATETLIVSAP